MKLFFISNFEKNNTDFIFQNNAPGEDIQSIQNEVIQDIESTGEADPEARKERNVLPPREISETETGIRTHNQETIVKIENGRFQIDGLDIDFPETQQKEAIRTAMLLNKLKSTGDAYEMKNGRIDKIGMIWNVTMYDRSTMSKFPTLVKNEDALNNYEPLRPTGVTAFSQKYNDKKAADWIKDKTK